MAKEVFISYSRKDFDKVRAIKNELDTTLGINCWMDLDGIESGDQFSNKIIAAINSHQVFLFMLSPNSMASEWALDELDFAKRKNKRIVLLYIESCTMTDEFYFLYHKYDTIEWDNFLQHDKLIRNLCSWLDVNTQNELKEEQDIPSVATTAQTKVLKPLGGPYDCVFLGSSYDHQLETARIVASKYKEAGILKKGHVVETYTERLSGEFVGQTAAITNNVINSALDGVLLFYKPYLLAKMFHGKEAIATLLERMEKDHDRLVVILAGPRVEMTKFIESNPALQARFTRFIDLPKFTIADLPLA